MTPTPFVPSGGPETERHEFGAIALAHLAIE
jgi:hypothetical protein